MNDQLFDTDAVFDFGEEGTPERYEVTDAIRQRANSAKNFSLVSMIVSIVLFALLIGTFGFSLMFPSGGILAIITAPFSLACAVIEGILMIGSIILNIIALVNTGKQRKEFNLYKDGPDKASLESTIKLGRIFTIIGVCVSALALVLIVPLNIAEFILSIL